VVHIAKGGAHKAILNSRPVRRISAYLVEGDFDASPPALAGNTGKAFQGSIVLGMGFTFDDEAAAKGTALSLQDMRRIESSHLPSASRIHPYLGGEELNNYPAKVHHRFVMNFNDLDIDRVEREFPDLFNALERFVRPDRQKEKIRRMVQCITSGGNTGEKGRSYINL
jgi:hypothetical protein